VYMVEDGYMDMFGHYFQISWSKVDEPRLILFQQLVYITGETKSNRNSRPLLENLIRLEPSNRGFPCCLNLVNYHARNRQFHS